MRRIIIFGLLSVALLISSCANMRIPAYDEEVELDEKPKPLNMDVLKKKIEYPQRARDAGIQGRVVLRVLIDKKGNYMKHKVVRSPHPWLSESGTAHIHLLKFSPGIKDGKAIPVWVTVPFDYKIEDSKSNE